ncbi:MAG: MBL fold metallo-hydrolase [Stagnimonas sp.]|nr:MBL fold metallo-hydrolase [Stagnimonas sp.]
MEISFHGATGTVTGSKYRVQQGSASVLVDCGLFQGYKQLRLRNRAAPSFDVRALDAVLLTHAHLDHSGYLPLLVKQGFSGPVYCTEATLELCRILLPDSGRLQEEDALHANRHQWSRHQPALPLYTEADAMQALDQLRACPQSQEFEAAPGLKARFDPAGHILGAAMLRLSSAHCRLLFSGDLGRQEDPIMAPPAPPPGADYLVVESTYGNRRHEATDPLLELGKLIRRTAKRGGVVVIPSFAVGRTQSLLWCIHQLKQQGLIPARIPVYLNSPMAIDVTGLYRRHPGEHRLDPEQCQAMCHAAKFINTVEESKALNQRKGPMIIIAGSGMATGGRVVHHLKAFAPDPRNCIVLAGFQAGGTRGAALIAGADSIKIHGEYVAVRAEIAQLSNLSAHADYVEILDWLRRMPRAPRQTFITHGEPVAADALRQRIEEQLHWNCSVPEFRERVALDKAR